MLRICLETEYRKHFVTPTDNLTKEKMYYMFRFAITYSQVSPRTMSTTSFSAIVFADGSHPSDMYESYTSTSK